MLRGRDRADALSAAHARIVAAAALGAAAVAALGLALFLADGGLNEAWMLRRGALLVAGAAVLGLVVAGCLAYARATPPTLRRSERVVAAVAALGTLLVLVVELYRGISRLE